MRIKRGKDWPPWESLRFMTAADVRDALDPLTSLMQKMAKDLDDKMMGSSDEKKSKFQKGAIDAEFKSIEENRIYTTAIVHVRPEKPQA